MKTEQMAENLRQLYVAGKIEIGKTYHVLPSDCSGNGMDIALKNRLDESADYDLGNGVVAKCRCSVQVGSTRWGDGIPTLYSIEVYCPDNQSKIDLSKLSNESLRKLNALARKAGYKSCTEAYYDKIDEPVIKHEPWGFETKSGKFFPGIRTTKWWKSGNYRPAKTIIYLPESFNL
ncbi:hypothetical protein SPIROBIBN47_410015 [uncultured spirochete]|uniref:Uncharacterized protein n=1 Tax=uncultured spirochete TaxID=156406 RepID=A0A3P3XMA6_9SPIR|nr:hypothetical protein SPIROBIBN47_410015 [uncultured spirochete]